MITDEEGGKENKQENEMAQRSTGKSGPY